MKNIFLSAIFAVAFTSNAQQIQLTEFSRNEFKLTSNLNPDGVYDIDSTLISSRVNYATYLFDLDNEILISNQNGKQTIDTISLTNHTGNGLYGLDSVIQVDVFHFNDSWIINFTKSTINILTDIGYIEFPGSIIEIIEQ
jgi:hypothetical protein